MLNFQQFTFLRIFALHTTSAAVNQTLSGAFVAHLAILSIQILEHYLGVVAGRSHLVLEYVVQNCGDVSDLVTALNGFPRHYIILRALKAGYIFFSHEKQQKHI
jgi:hypothetical protein